MGERNMRAMILMAIVCLHVNGCMGFVAGALSRSVPQRFPLVHTSFLPSKTLGAPGKSSCFSAQRLHCCDRRKIQLQMQEEGLKEIIADVDVMAAPLRSFGVLSAWVGFGMYTLLAPPHVPQSVTADFFLQCVSLKETVNPLFGALFFLFGFWNVTFAALLLPMKSRSQKLPAWPFLSLTWALGIGAIAPYLALTRYEMTEEETEDPGLWGGTALGIVSLVTTVVLYMYGVGVFAPNNINGGSDYTVDVILYSYLKAYPTLFSENKFVNLTTCDSVCLWVLMIKPLLEDMKWRGWFKGEVADWALLSSFMAVPFIGPCVWLSVRRLLRHSRAKRAMGLHNETYTEQLMACRCNSHGHAGSHRCRLSDSDATVAVER